MKERVTVIKNIESKMYDVVVVIGSNDIVLETICSCKTYENAEWIVEMIKKENE